MWQEAHPGEDAEAWLRGLDVAGRYATDVFA
jgi:hypothetical protein